MIHLYMKVQQTPPPPRFGLVSHRLWSGDFEELERKRAYYRKHMLPDDFTADPDIHVIHNTMRRGPVIRTSH